MPIQTVVLQNDSFELAVEFEWQTGDEGKTIEAIYGAWPARLPKTMKTPAYDISAFFGEGDLELKIEQHFNN